MDKKRLMQIVVIIYTVIFLLGFLLTYQVRYYLQPKAMVIALLIIDVLSYFGLLAIIYFAIWFSITDPGFVKDLFYPWFDDRGGPLWYWKQKRKPPKK